MYVNGITALQPMELVGREDCVLHCSGDEQSIVALQPTR